MAITTLTPGVYIEEISTLPPSVAPVATAIPAFIGYTETGTAFQPTRITSLPEFVSIFGGAAKEAFTVNVDDTPILGPVESRSISVTLTTASEYNLFYSLQLYFANGGGPCWIVSIGSNASGSPSLTHYIDAGKGLDAIEKIDEPTLLLFPDAVNLASDANYGTLVSSALQQCNALQDRFVISDVRDNDIDNISGYRTAIGNSNLKYGAAYMPFLNTVFNYAVDQTQSIIYTGPDAYLQTNPDLDSIQSTRPDVYAAIMAKINEFTVTLPPSGAMAGIYASVDRDRGVWKAPANISINAISSPTVIITTSEQADLNVDAGSGKSINAIRPFTGKGTLVWGARTLAGNDNEWRYVNVRRLFIYAEESIKKASEFVVFEPNDANTWNRVRGLISNFLTNLWRDGGLVGPTPAQAFFVKVGLGETMTPQDILEGKLIVEVGLAASRPAEFIILKFSHKLQEA